MNIFMDGIAVDLQSAERDETNTLPLSRGMDHLASVGCGMRHSDILGSLFAIVENCDAIKIHLSFNGRHKNKDLIVILFGSFSQRKEDTFLI